MLSHSGIRPESGSDHKLIEAKYSAHETRRQME